LKKIIWNFHSFYFLSPFCQNKIKDPKSAVVSLALHAICKEKNSRVSDPPGKPKNVGNDHQNPPAQFLQRYLIKKINPNMPFSAAHKK
jgi:hypothetical protein